MTFEGGPGDGQDEAQRATLPNLRAILNDGRKHNVGRIVLRPRPPAVPNRAARRALRRKSKGQPL